MNVLMLCLRLTPLTKESYARINKVDLITIKLEEASIDTPLNKNINSSYLQNITITPIGDQIQITAKVSNNVVLQASKTSDSYGLRLRFSAPAVVPLTTEDTTDKAASLPTKDGSEFERSYYVVIGILVIGIAILFWLKQNIATRATAIHAAPKTPWLFNSSSTKTTAPLSTPTQQYRRWRSTHTLSKNS